MAAPKNSIITPQIPQAAVVVTTTATAAAPYGQTPTNTVQLAGMGANGGRVTRIRSRPTNTVTATSMLLFLSIDNGAHKLLIDSTLLPAQTVSATQAVTGTDWGYSDASPMILPANSQLYVANAVTSTDGIATEIEWADY
jgi:hypothetical protein